MPDESQWERIRRQNLIPVQVHECDFRGRDEVVVLFLIAVEVFAELGKLPGGVERLFGEHVGQVVLGEAGARMFVEHELDQGALKPRDAAAQHEEAAAGHLDPALEVDSGEDIAEFPVRAGRERELRFLAHGFDHDIRQLVEAGRHARVEHVRDFEQLLVQFFLDSLKQAVQPVDLVAHKAHLGDADLPLLGVFRGTDSLTRGVPLRAQLFDLPEEAATVVVETDDAVHGRAGVAQQDVALHALGVLTNELDAQHRVTPGRRQ
ncbi:MAG TPA: hypothetical protein PKA49_05985 [Tepidiformaceae bacterium]|nr:hypothetical protein [Tepidiformaceae bacterium]